MSNYQMWTEKYQPRNLSECVLEAFSDQVQTQFKLLEHADNIPNILLFGIAGTG